MILRVLTAGLAGVIALTLLSAPSEAQTTRRGVRNDHTVIVTRDEDGRTRTRIVVQRRSFLDPGNQVFPGENRYNSGPALVYQPTFTTGADRGTVFDRGQPPLPGLFELPFKENPVGRPQ